RARECQDAAVVVGITVTVQQHRAGDVRQRVDDIGAPALAHVDDALEHGPTLAWMELGFALPQFDFSVPGEAPIQWPTVARWAQRAESLGFGSLWVADHLMLGIEKYGGSGEYAGSDALATLPAPARIPARPHLAP